MNILKSNTPKELVKIQTLLDGKSNKLVYIRLRKHPNCCRLALEAKYLYKLYPEDERYNLKDPHK